MRPLVLTWGLWSRSENHLPSASSNGCLVKNPWGAVVVGHLGRPLRQCTATKFVEDVSHLGSFGSWVMSHFETIGCQDLCKHKFPPPKTSQQQRGRERERVRVGKHIVDRFHHGSISLNYNNPQKTIKKKYEKVTYSGWLRNRTGGWVDLIWSPLISSYSPSVSSAPTCMICIQVGQLRLSELDSGKTMEKRHGNPMENTEKCHGKKCQLGLFNNGLHAPTFFEEYIIHEQYTVVAVLQTNPFVIGNIEERWPRWMGAKHGVPTWPARGMSWYVYYNGTTKMRQQRMKLEARVEVRKAVFWSCCMQVTIGCKSQTVQIFWWSRWRSWGWWRWCGWWEWWGWWRCWGWKWGWLLWWAGLL